MLVADCVEYVKLFWPRILIALLVLKLLNNRYLTGLRSIPGPWLASCTDLWRLVVVWRRRPEVTHIALHRKYGDIVRLGPNAVSISDFEEAKKIYALNSGFTKSAFYPVQQTISRGKPLHSLFNTRDEKFHSKLRREVSNAYAMSTLVQFEPLVDSAIEVFLIELEKRFANRPGEDGICDFGTWLQYYAFDVIGELTYSKRLGFIEEGKDVDGIIGSLESLLNYAATVGQMPILDQFLIKNPIRLWCSDHGLLNTNTGVVNFAKERMATRLSSKDPLAYQEASKGQVARRDFLSRFLEGNKKNPEFMNDQRVLALTVANMFAGSDTTAITLRAIFYYLLKNPPQIVRLMQELEQTRAGSGFSQDDNVFRWEEMRDLPYLGAAVKEALRMHPAVGLTLERVVPEGGTTLCGRFIPEGTIVGASAWTIHRQESIFGPETDKFRPERWIEVSEEKKTEMNNALFSFGMGARTCIGKNISLLEMYKLVPALLTRFEVTFADPNAEWKLHNAWFVKQSDFNIRLKRRSIK